MKKFRAISLLLSLTLIFCAIPEKRTITDLNAWNDGADKSLELSVRAIKRKVAKADVTVVFKNSYPFTMIIPENSIRFFINKDQGVGSQNPHWVLKPGDVVSELMTFKFAAVETGPIALKLDYIYQGKSVDLPVNLKLQSSVAVEDAGRKSVVESAALYPEPIEIP